MTTDNCVDICPWVEQDGTCCGQCIMKIKPIETLSDEQIQRGKGSSLILVGDE